MGILVNHKDSGNFGLVKLLKINHLLIVEISGGLLVSMDGSAFCVIQSDLPLTVTKYSNYVISKLGTK